MSTKRAQAPLYTDAYDFSLWLLGRAREGGDVLARRLAERGLDLLEAISLALRDRRRAERLEHADEQLLAIRTELRLAADLGLLDERQLCFALECADRIGRQLGGWRRSLGDDP